MAQCVQQEANNQKSGNRQKAATWAQINDANRANINANRMRTTNCTGFGNMVNCTTY